MTREEQIYKKAEGDCIAMLESIERGDIIKGSICPQSYRAGFMDGAKWADQYPHWIPVEEYPKVDISCTLLVHYVDGTIDICDYYGDFYDYTGENVTRNVTHWMPMPEAPRMEE